ncbi:uncharacterized protein LOC114531672 [Dendronephthya gigantea]|uniref:uncharacterized protein LOC114531672 n=1 Tax=Dendronephthya gigantea TaxID=151771 RepID=UPI001069082C|nr:uncharacterized protein LOC114531672 [Dendronephthya gigantea]
MGTDALLNVAQGDEETLLELKSLGILVEPCDRQGSTAEKNPEKIKLIQNEENNPAVYNTNDNPEGTCLVQEDGQPEADINRNTIKSCDKNLATDTVEGSGYRKLPDSEPLYASERNQQSFVQSVPSVNYLSNENILIGGCSEPSDHEMSQEGAKDQVESFMNQIKDSEQFLDLIENRVLELNNDKESLEVEELLAEFCCRDQDFENVLETGMGLVRDISEDEKFGVEEKIVVVEGRWNDLKEELVKRKTTIETVFMLENCLKKFEKFVEEVSEFVSGKDANTEWLFTDEEAGCIVDCYLGRLEREQVALKGLIEGTKHILSNAAGESIEEQLNQVSKTQMELANNLLEKKAMVERWVEFSLSLEGVECEVEALTAEFEDLVEGEDSEFIMERHLNESRVHMLKILLGSLVGKQNKLRELSAEYKDVLNFSKDCDEKVKEHETTISKKIELVSEKLEKLESYLDSFKELEFETNELQVKVKEADKALTTFGQSTCAEVRSRTTPLEQLSEIKHLEENILKLEPRVKLVKEKSLERLDQLDYENSGYWFQENIKCLVASYERARTRVRKNVKSIESCVSLKDKFDLKFLEISAFLEKVEEYLNEDEEIPGNFDVTAKEVALVSGRRFLEEMALKEDCLRELVEMSESVSNEDEDERDVLQLRERFNIRLKELKRNVDCLDVTLQCYNDFEEKVEELSSLMYEVQGFLYGEGVETRGLEDLLELGRSCLENVENKEGTLIELKNRVERLTESFREEEKEVIIAELGSLEEKLAFLKATVLQRMECLEALASRHDVYKNELKEVKKCISSLEQETETRDGLVPKKVNENVDPVSLQRNGKSDSVLTVKKAEESWLEKLEAFRARLQNLDKMKTELLEETQESNIDLGGASLGLEPLELTVADLERINEKKIKELREHEEQQEMISRKVSEFEEELGRLRNEVEENKVGPIIVEETMTKTKVLLQEVDTTLASVAPKQRYSVESIQLIERLENIRDNCIEIKRHLIRVDPSIARLSEDQISSESGCQVLTVVAEKDGQQDIAGDEVIREDIQPTANVAQRDISNVVITTDATDEDTTLEGEGEGLQPNNSIEDKSDENAKHFPSEKLIQQPKVKIESVAFEILQSEVESLANDEEVMAIIISNSEQTTGNLHKELEAAQAKLELLQQKEQQLQSISSQAEGMWATIPSEGQKICQENIVEIEEKLSTAKECLFTRIKMLQQCAQTKEMLEQNILECHDVLDAVGKLREPAMVREFLEVLRDPNSCFENATRLSFALSVVGGIEEEECFPKELEDLRERWENAMKDLEQRISGEVGMELESKSSKYISEKGVDLKQDPPGELVKGVADMGCQSDGNSLMLTEYKDSVIEQEREIDADSLEDAAEIENLVADQESGEADDGTLMVNGLNEEAVIQPQVKEVAGPENVIQKRSSSFNERKGSGFEEAEIDVYFKEGTAEQRVVEVAELSTLSTLEEEKAKDIKEESESVVISEVALAEQQVTDSSMLNKHNDFDSRYEGGNDVGSKDDITEPANEGCETEEVRSDINLRQEVSGKNLTQGDSLKNITFDENTGEDFTRKNDNQDETAKDEFTQEDIIEHGINDERLGLVVKDEAGLSDLSRGRILQQGTGQEKVITEVVTPDEYTYKESKTQSEFTSEELSQNNITLLNVSQREIRHELHVTQDKAIQDEVAEKEIDKGMTNEKNEAVGRSDIVDDVSLDENIQERVTRGEMAPVESTQQKSDQGEFIQGEESRDIILRQEETLDLICSRVPQQNFDYGRKRTSEVADEENIQNQSFRIIDAGVVEQDTQDEIAQVSVSQAKIIADNNIQSKPITDSNHMLGTDRQITPKQPALDDVSDIEGRQNNFNETGGLSPRAIVDSKIQIQDDKIQDDKIEDDKIQDDKIQDDKIQDDEIQDDKIEDDKIQDDKIKDDKIQDDKIQDDEIQDVKIEDDKIQDDKIQGDKIQDDKIQDDKIQGDKIQGDKIQDDKIQDDKIQDDKIQDDKIQDDKIQGDKIQDDKIQDDKIQDDKIPDDKRQDKIQDDKIQDDKIQDDKIQDGKIQDDKIFIEKTKGSSNDYEKVVELDFKDFTIPSFFVASQKDTLQETKALKLEEALDTISKVSSELAMIKNVSRIQKISPENLLEYERKSLNELRSISKKLETIASEEFNLDSVEMDKKTLLNNLVREQQQELARVREALTNRVRKIKRFFEMKSTMKDKIEGMNVVLEEAIFLEEDDCDSREQKAEKMTRILIGGDDLAEEFVDCMASLTSDYPSLDLSYAGQIHERYQARKSELTRMLDVAKKQLEEKENLEDKIDLCSQWLVENEKDILKGEINDTDVDVLEKAINDLDEFLVVLDGKIEYFHSYATRERLFLDNLPTQEKDVLLTKVNNLEKRLAEARGLVLKRIEDVKIQVDIVRHRNTVDACQIWQEKVKDALNSSGKSSECVFTELSDLVSEGEELIENVKSLRQRSVEDQELVESAKEVLQTAKEVMETISRKEEAIKQLSFEVSELESRILVCFERNENTDEIEILKFEEEIENARERLQNISNQIKSGAPHLEAFPANPRENELLQRSEDLLNEIKERNDRRLLEENLEDCKKTLEKVEDICNMPVTFCLDVVKMKKDLAEMGKISLELKDKEAKLQKVQPLGNERVAEVFTSLQELGEELEMREEKMAEFLSTLRHVLRSIQELEHITQDENGNDCDNEEKSKNLKEKISQVDRVKQRVDQLCSLPQEEKDVLHKQINALESDIKFKMEQLENGKRSKGFGRRLENVRDKIAEIEERLNEFGNDRKAFSDQFALVSEEVGKIVEEGELLVSSGNTDADGQLSAKLQDVRRRFLRIQELVEKQDDCFERFEDAVAEYKQKFEAVKCRISLSGFEQQTGVPRSFVEEKNELTLLDENFRTLQALGREIRSSVSEEQKNRIDLLLSELRTSLKMVKARISGELVDENEHVGETRDTKGFGMDISHAVRRGEDRMIGAMRLSDDSDVDNEEHRVLAGSSDGSQYGSDSGMGDSLMNTFASEVTDGPSKTPTVSPVHKEGCSEACGSVDTVCEDSPVNKSRITEQFAQARSGKYSEGRQDNPTRTSQDIDLIGQVEILGSIDEVSPSDAPGIPRKNEQSMAGVIQSHDCVMNAIGDDENVDDGKFVLKDITQNVPPVSDGDTTVPSSDLPRDGNLMKIDEDSDNGSLEYLVQDNLFKMIPGKDSQTQNDIRLDNLDAETVQLENTDQASSDSRPFIPVGFLEPEPITFDKTQEASSLPDFKPSDQTPYEMKISRHSLHDISPSEQTASEDSLSVQTSSEDSSPQKSPQKSRVHDIDEELLLRNRAIQDLQPDEELREGQNLETEYPLVSSAPPPMKTVEEFVEEPDELFQRLVDIEVMLKPQENEEENLKSALLKHVALCVEMKNIQSKINTINRHGPYFMKKARSGLREILEERLRALNKQWDKLQGHATARQKDLEQLVQDKADNELVAGEDSSLSSLRNNTALLSSLYFNTENESIKRLLNKLGLFSGQCDEEDDESRRHFDDDFLDYQSAFHDLFEWLTAVEEEIESVSTSEGEVKEIKQRVKCLQDLYLKIQHKKPQVNELVKRSERFVDSSSEGNEEHVTGLRNLWRDVMLKACSKLRDLQNVLHVVMMKALNVNNKEDFLKTLSECQRDVKDLLQRLQECCTGDTSDDPAVAAAQYQVFASETDRLTKLLDVLQTSLHVEQNTTALKELSDQMTVVKTQLESWWKNLNEAGALETIVETDTRREVNVSESIPEELRSPRSRPKTWPDHSTLLTQVLEEVKKFEDWLKTAEENLQIFIGIAIPQTLNEMKSKLKEVQLAARNINNKITEMEYTLDSLNTLKDESGYPELCEKCQSCLTHAKELKSRSDTRTDELKEIRYKWELFESRFAEMIHWLEKTRSILILPLKERDEDSVEFVLGKLLKVREIEKKLSEKVMVKDDLLRQGEHVHARTEAAGVNVKIEQLREEWTGIESDLGRERGRLEKVMRLWKDYDRKQEEMYDWLTGILSSLRDLEHRDRSIEVVKRQIALIQKHHDEIDNHITLKESVDLSFHFLVDNIQGDVERLQEKQQKLNSHWQELQSLVSDRFDELVAVEWTLEVADMTANVDELNVCVENARRLVLARVPQIGSSSLEEIKSLVASYQNAKRELRSKQEIVDGLRRKSRDENMKDEKCTSLRQSIAQLDEDWKSVTSLLNEKEEAVKISLNKWMDFQRQLTHLVDTDSWFATREAAMSKYQHISTEKDRISRLEI